jgi:predicted DNA-binding protein with PD1-like motif
MKTLPIRLKPGDDVRRTLETAVAGTGCSAAFVIAGIGSLCEARMRYAGAADARTLTEALEILTLAGTIAGDGASHLHASLARANGEVFGGHVAHGCIVRTTAEVLVALFDDWDFVRAPDALTGYDELVVRRNAASGDG